MLKSTVCVDFLIIGAGIVGLSIARELNIQFPRAKIVILEKESVVGLHASGRNSGVLHSGIYYKEGSLKAKFCLEGSRELAAYCDEHNLPISRIGKIILPAKEVDLTILDILYKRATSNGANVQLITGTELRSLEPKANSKYDRALFCPETSVVDSKKILLHLQQSLINKGVVISVDSRCTEINIKNKCVNVNDKSYFYGHLFNAAGLQADVIAKHSGVADEFTMIPFKGMYYELSPNTSVNLYQLLYPAPDINIPFLGVHFTRAINGKIYVGPTAMPALGRENYRGFIGSNLEDTLKIFTSFAQQYLLNKQGIRAYTNREILPLFFKSRFVTSARSLVPSLDKKDLMKSSKVGIRAQLYDKKKKELVMDFMIKSTENETHVLNAVSPAFTSAFSFSKYLIQEYSLNKPNSRENELAV